jgi:hypothetical protein
MTQASHEIAYQRNRASSHNILILLGLLCLFERLGKIREASLQVESVKANRQTPALRQSFWAPVRRTMPKGIPGTTSTLPMTVWSKACCPYLPANPAMMTQAVNKLAQSVNEVWGWNLYFR